METVLFTTLVVTLTVFSIIYNHTRKRLDAICKKQQAENNRYITHLHNMTIAISELSEVLKDSVQESREEWQVPKASLMCLLGTAQYYLFQIKSSTVKAEAYELTAQIDRLTSDIHKLIDAYNECSPS